MWRHVVSTLICGAVLVPGALAQDVADTTRPTAATQVPAGPPPFANMKGFSGDYQVGPGDLLDVTVIGHDDLKQSLRVSNSGEISFPMLGPITVVDTTPFDIENEIADRLRAKGLVQQPEVMVFVREYQAKPIYVSGAVTTPGEFVMSQDLTVMDAILLAGGLRFNAADEALLHRRVGSAVSAVSTSAITSAAGEATAGVEVIRVDLKPLKEGRFLDESVPLKRGDVLVVPEQQMNAFFVVGDVIDPRNFYYPPGKKLMASQAISWAGGPNPTAKMSSGVLVRYDEHGQRTERKVDFAAVLDGRQADVQIEPNDVIFIPGGKVKTIAHGMLLMTDEYMMTTSFKIGRNMQLPDQPDPTTVHRTPQ